MSYRNNEANTRPKIPDFSVDEWIEFRYRLEQLVRENQLSPRNEEILRELIYKQKTTEQLAYLARSDENYAWLQSNQNKPMSSRRIHQILTEYFPEFHIQKTHKKEKDNQKIRNEHPKLRDAIITKDSRCGRCGCHQNLQIHHMMSVMLNGDNDERNLVILCKDCHRQTTTYNQRFIHDSNDNQL